VILCFVDVGAFQIYLEGEGLGSQAGDINLSFASKCFKNIFPNVSPWSSQLERGSHLIQEKAFDL
jgi:hypothetical protein